MASLILLAAPSAAQDREPFPGTAPEYAQLMWDYGNIVTKYCRLAATKYRYGVKVITKKDFSECGGLHGCPGIVITQEGQGPREISAGCYSSQWPKSRLDRLKATFESYKATMKALTEQEEARVKALPKAAWKALDESDGIEGELADIKRSLADLKDLIESSTHTNNTSRSNGPRPPPSQTTRREVRPTFAHQVIGSDVVIFASNTGNVPFRCVIDFDYAYDNYGATTDQHFNKAANVAGGLRNAEVARARTAGSNVRITTAPSYQCIPLQ